MISEASGVAGGYYFSSIRYLIIYIYTDIIVSVYITGLARQEQASVPVSQGFTAKKVKGCGDDWREIERSSALRRDASLLFKWCGADSEKVSFLGWSEFLDSRKLADILACMLPLSDSGLSDSVLWGRI